MKPPVIRILRAALRGCLAGMLCGLLWHSAAHAAATVQRAVLDAGTGTLEIALSARTMFKALQLDAREIMVAFRSADLDPSTAGSHSGSGLVKQFTVEKLPDQVVSLMIDTTADIRAVQAEWRGDSATLRVHLSSKDVQAVTEIPVKRRKYKKDALVKAVGESAPAVAPASSRPAAPEPSGPAAEAGPPAGPVQAGLKLPDASSGSLALPAADGQTLSRPREAWLTAFMKEVSGGACANLPVLADALTLCKKNEWEKAFGLLGTGIDPAASDACQADLYYLRAISAINMNTAGSQRLYLDAVSCFQDALSYYPDSAHAPFAMLALASLYNELESRAEARGYYKLILKTYADHAVAAEALLGLGNLYAREGKQELAIGTYRQYLKAYPQSSRITDARLALGVSLYELSDFTESLDVLSRVIDDDPRRIYEDPDLLVTIGFLHYQLGDMDSARDALTKAVNLFPGSDQVPDLLASIGDTLKEEGRKDQAKRVYELVMETYPDTDGFAVSAIRTADLLSERPEKEALYRMVMERFPGHPVTKLAVIRLASLQQQAGEYSAGIETLRESMSGKELKNEAEYVMASCFDGYFRRLAERGDPLAIIAAYEKDKAMVNRFENPDIFETVGTAFYQAKFFSQAEALFQNAYKASSPDSRPASLYYRLAVTLQELGKDMQAREMFHAYFRKLPENELDPDAYLRMGRLLAAEESWETALAFINAGFQKSGSNMQRAEFLLLQAEVFVGMGKETTVPDLLVKAINLMASSPDAGNKELMKAYRQLGETYMNLSAFEKAGDAFTMALNFSEGTRPPALLYLLAESNLKSQNPEAARMVLTEILGAGDDFWSRMAEERLRTLTLEEKLERQTPPTTGI